MLPGMPNLHSHAFQRAMAGLAERQGPDEASFWSWRAVMYRFLERIGPDELAAIAAQLYVEMLEAGYTAVGEFHYLHHQPDGGAYADPAELSQAILAAQRQAGIGLTHLPVLYMAGGFGGAPPEPGPAPFRPRSGWLRRAAGAGPRRAAAATRTSGSASRRIRCAPCRTRRCCEAIGIIDRIDPRRRSTSTSPSRCARCATAWPGAAGARSRICSRSPRSGRAGAWSTPPTWTTTRPGALAQSGAVAGLCPTTEANLGDGLFNLAAFLEAGGRFGIGSDSHVSVSPIEELRWLEYGQRLDALRRLVGGEPGRAALRRPALAGGAGGRRPGARPQDRPPRARAAGPI